jgi:3-oxoacyl-[acyl-carrier protein] reductase
VAIVTGAAGGIGRGVVDGLARAGANLCLVDMQDCSDVARLAEKAGVSVVTVDGDVSVKATAGNVVEKALGRFGRIDYLINVAGLAGYGSIASLGEADWDRIFDVNVKGTFLFCQAVIAPMKERRFGRIVNMGSVVGKNGGNSKPWLDPAEQERTGNAAYGASKAAVHAFTAYLAKELAAYRITVNAIAPGPIATGALLSKFSPELWKFIPAGRLGTVEEIEHAVSFLLSERSGFITGEVLDVNGGLWMD